MPRVTDSSTIAALSSDSIRLATLIKLDFPTPVYLTDYGQNITYGGNTYQASSSILSVGESTETGGIKVNSMSLELSGVEQSFVSLFLTSDYMNKQVLIDRVVLDDQDDVIGQSITYFDGRITSYEISDSGSDSEISVEFASHWQDFEKVQNRKTNSKSQNFWFPDDKGFQYASSIETRSLKWGRK